MRVLGVDFGGKRIGIAVGETEFKIASPRSPIAASGTLRIDAEHISKLVKTEGAEQVVVGVPLDQDGNETKMSGICRKLGAEIEKAGLKVSFVDESMTSLGAESALKQYDLTAAQRRRHIDSEAACRIIERFFDA